MTLNGKRDGFTLEDFEDCARVASMKRGAARRIVDEVRAAVSRWPQFAADAVIDPRQVEQISRAQRLELPPR